MVNSPGVKNGYALKIAGFTTEEDLVAIRRDGEIALILASGCDIWGKEPGVVTRRNLPEVIAPDYRRLAGFLIARQACSYRYGSYQNYKIK